MSIASGLFTAHRRGPVIILRGTVHLPGVDPLFSCEQTASIGPTLEVSLIYNGFYRTGTTPVPIHLELRDDAEIATSVKIKDSGGGCLRVPIL